MNRYQGTTLECWWLSLTTGITILATFFHLATSWLEYWVICDFGIPGGGPYFDEMLPGYVCKLYSGLWRTCFEYNANIPPPPTTVLPSTSSFIQINEESKINNVSDQSSNNIDASTICRNSLRMFYD